MIRVAILQIIFEYLIILQKCQDLQMLAILTNTSKKVEWIKQDRSISYLCKVYAEVLELWLAFFQAVVMDTETCVLWLCRRPCGFQGFRAYLHQAGAEWQELEGCAGDPYTSQAWRATHLLQPYPVGGNLAI